MSPSSGGDSCCVDVHCSACSRPGRQPLQCLRSGSPERLPQARRRARITPDADQAPGRDLPGERLLRPLLRHLPDRSEHRRPAVLCPARDTCRRRAHCRRPTLRSRPRCSTRTDLTAHEPELGAAAAARQQRRTVSPGGTAASETCDQDHNYSDEQQSFDGGKMDQFVQSVGTASGKTPERRGACATGDRHGLLRRQLDDGALELRTALLDERQLVRHDVRAVGARRDQPRLRGHRRRRHESAHEANEPVGRHLDRPERRPDARRQRRVSRSRATPSRTGTTARRATPSR